MPINSRILVYLLCALWVLPLHAQVLRSEENDPNSPAYGKVRPQPGPVLESRLERMRELVRELQQSDLDASRKQVALEQLLRDYDDILRGHQSWLDWQKPQTVDSAAALLEKMIFEEAAALAPDEQSREQVLRRAPSHLALDPNQPADDAVYEPPLLSPVYPQRKKIATRPIPAVTPAAVETAAVEPATAEPQPPPTPPPATDKKPETRDSDKKVQVAVLTDDKTTTAMHDDNTALRQVKNKQGDLVLFGALHLWAGGALQLDGYWGKGLFNLEDGGNSDLKSYIRRGEGIVRASLFEHSEVKIQYDFDSNIFRDVYWRWLSASGSSTLTIGNQKEPMGQDWMVGSKFTTALEPSGPTSTFGSYRSKGIRYNGSRALASQDNPFKIWGDSRTYLTSSIGLFGEDIENSNDTDWAVTGRVSMGGNKTGHSGFHLGAAASYRHGEYDRIAPRPGLQDVNRIPLASLDAEGWGGYGQVGWLFNGKRRQYRPNWGLWAPIEAGDEQLFEVFARISLTHGNDDVNSSNELYLLTLGGNWYYRRFRVSANIILADTKRDIARENNGHALGLRLQYLF